MAGVVLMAAGVIVLLLGMFALTEGEEAGFLALFAGLVVAGVGLLALVNEAQPAPAKTGGDYVTTTVTTEG